MKPRGTAGGNLPVDDDPQGQRASSGSNDPYIATSSTDETQRQTREIEASAYTVLHPSEVEYEGLNMPRPSQKLRKLEKNFEKKEGEHMQHSDRESKLVEVLTAGGRDERPPPKFQCGQTVHHFWASWMSEATAPPKQMKQKMRPKWYSALVTALPTWETGTYGGMEFTGWHYNAH